MLVKPNHKNDKHADDTDPLVEAYRTIINYATNNMQVSESEKANFADTPVRAAKAFRDLVWPIDKITTELEQILATGFPLENSTEETGIITQGPISVESMCPHHLLAVRYEVFVSYKPVKGGTVLGLSKLARLSQVLGKRPVLQEQLARDIANALHYHPMYEQVFVEEPPAQTVSGSRASQHMFQGANLSAELPPGDYKIGHTVSRPFEYALPQIESEGSAVQLLGRHSCMSCRGVKENAVTLSTELRGAFKRQSLKDEFYQAITSIRSAK